MNLDYKVKERIGALDMDEDAMSRSMENYYLIVPDGGIGRVAAALGEDETTSGSLAYNYSFDIGLPAAGQITPAKSIGNELGETGLNAYALVFVGFDEAERQAIINSTDLSVYK